MDDKVEWPRSPQEVLEFGLYLLGVTGLAFAAAVLILSLERVTS